MPAMSALSGPIVVTGANGLVGTAVMEALADMQGAEIVALVRNAEPVAHAARIVRADLNDQPALASALAEIRPAAIVHIAGRTRGTIAELYRDNTASTATLAEAVLKSCPGAIVTAIGSAAEYGTRTTGEKLHEDSPRRPVSPYGHAKLAAAVYLDAAASRGLRHNLVRVFNPMGVVNSPRQVLGSFIARAARIAVTGGEPRVQMGRLDAVRDFVALSDIARIVCALVEGHHAGVVVNACTGQGLVVRDVIRFVADLSGLPFEIVEDGVEPKVPDMAIGDDTRARQLLGGGDFQSMQATLERAWQVALEAARTSS